MKKQNALLLLAVILLAVLPLLWVRPSSGDTELFTGSDAQATALITKDHSEYKPWFTPFWEPPSSEIESLLFALQAAIGAGIVGYTIGYFRGKRKADSAP